MRRRDLNGERVDHLLHKEREEFQPLKVHWKMVQGDEWRMEVMGTMRLWPGKWTSVNL